MTDLDEYDYFGVDPASRADPYRFFALAREAGPVFREPHRGVYVLTRYDDIVDVARDTSRFSSIVSPSGPDTVFPGTLDLSDVAGSVAGFRSQMVANIPLITLDPPDHTRYRSLVSKFFSPARVRSLEPYVASLAHELIDEFAEKGEVEFVRAFAGPYPLLVIADLLGVPREDQGEFKRLLQDDIGDADLVGNPNHDNGAINGELQVHILQYFNKYIEERRAHPTDDVLSALANAHFSDTGEQPSTFDIIALAFVIFGAGQETTSRLFTNGMLVLAKNPDLADALRADPTKLDNFVEEALRFETPVKGLFRLALVDVEISGTVIPAGSVVMLAFAAGNHDPEHFPDPESFDPARPNARNTLSFGHGAHFCPGASLARVEGRIGFAALLERMRDISLRDPDAAIDYVPSYVLRGLGAMDLRFTPSG